MFFYSLLIAIIWISSIKSELNVQVDNGEIIGHTVALDGIVVNEYLAIPYAEPPIGDLRFRRPKKISSLEGTLTADKLSPACPQYTNKPYPWYYNGTEKSEDCLYLNIWTPSDASPNNTKAVFYWIYGGGWRYGTNRDPLYNGTAMTALGDVIVVTVNYRVGPFGFLFSGSEDAPGNAGIWDVFTGLQWVNEHIAAFGGDTSRLTIAGESAGSAMTGLFNLSPLAKGLFTQMIMESGAPISILVDGAPNLQLSQTLASLVSCANDTYTINEHPKEVTECLRGVDFNELSVSDLALNPYFTADFLPRFGDELVPRNPNEVLSGGDYGCVPLLIGLNDDEGTNMVSPTFPDIFDFFGENDPHINRTQAIEIMSTVIPLFTKNIDAVVEYYLPSDLEDTGNVYRDRACDAFGESYIVCPALDFARKCALKNNQVYFYNWKHRPSTSVWAEWEGVAHFTELEFVFGRPLLIPDSYQQDEIDLSRQVIDYWTNFIKNGTPNETWPLYSESNPIVRNLAVGSLMNTEEPGVHLESCKHLMKLYNFP